MTIASILISVADFFVTFFTCRFNSLLTMFFTLHSHNPLSTSHKKNLFRSVPPIG